MCPRLSIVLVIASILQITPSVAQNATPSHSSEFEKWDTTRLFKEGEALLTWGRSYERAIILLRIAARRDPANLDYQLALGCVCASRFASIALASRQFERFEFEQKQYERRKAEWEKAQNDPAHPAFGTPEPEPPVPPSTPDDGRRYEMKKEEARQRLKELGRESIKAFEAAHRIAEAAPAERRSKAEYIRGWGLFLLRRFGMDVVKDRPFQSVQNQMRAATNDTAKSLYISPEDVIACFRQCTEDDPDKANYWQSLGLSFIPKYVSAAEHGSYAEFAEGAPIHKKEDVAAAIQAFQRALSQKPDDFQLLYQIALIVAPTNPVEAVDYLEKATGRVKTNAVLWYLTAEQRFRQAEKSKEGDVRALQEKAIAAIQTGNSAPQYWAVPFTLPIPSYLRKAWDYSRVYGLGEDAHTLMVLMSYLSDYISKSIVQGDDEVVLRVVPIMMGMGLRAVRGFNAGDLDLRDPRARDILRVRLTMGILNGLKAYDLMKKAQEARPDARKARILEEYTVIREYLRALDKEVVRFL